MKCKICEKEFTNLSYHLITIHKVDYIDYLLKYDYIHQPKCKMCDNDIDIKTINSTGRRKITKGIIPQYCSNKCKFQDKEYNKKRGIKPIINDYSKECECIECKWISDDINNLSGALTKHLNNIHNIKDKEYNKYFNIKNKKILNKWICPICNWESIDIENKSGMILNHIINNHNIKNVFDWNSLYPDYIINISIKNKKKKERNDKGIVCKICGEKFKTISSSHLALHNLTPEKYKELYGNEIVCKDTISKLSENSNNPIIKEKMIKKILKTNNEKYGTNSYTQTEEGKNRVQQTTFNNTYDNYIKSEKLAEFVELLFTKEEYKGNGEEYKFKCKKCNNEFMGKIENGRIPRCLMCYPLNAGFSLEEKEVLKYITEELNIEMIEDYIIRNDTLDKIEVDMFSPKYNIAIEYDGLYWHSEIERGKGKDYHINKTKICEQKGIQLIHIFSDEWLYKNEIVKFKLKNLFKLNTNKIYARKCNIKKISYKEKDDFLNKNHIQGTDRSLYQFGLFYKNELVEVITFSHYKYIKSDETIFELSRFAGKYDTIVVGGFSKLLKYFISNYNVKKIISFADRRWTFNNENVYIKNNFKLNSIIEPSYWYLYKHSVRYHRFNFRKKLLPKKLEIYDEALTEWQNMQLNKYDRIWDCGNYKYELTIDNNVK